MRSITRFTIGILAASAIQYALLPSLCNAQVSPCTADIRPLPSGDGVVGVNDLLAVLNSWGPVNNPTTAAITSCDIAPIGGNDAVNVDDLLLVINSWGPCPGPLGGAAVAITDTWSQILPPVCEAFQRVELQIDANHPPQNRYGFKAKVVNLPAGVKIASYKWTVDGIPAGDLVNLDPQDNQLPANEATPAAVPNPTVFVGANARGIQFKSWDGIDTDGIPANEVANKNVKVEVKLNDPANTVLTAQITVKVNDYLQLDMVKEHVDWHNCFDFFNCPGPYNSFPGGQELKYKYGFLFLQFHRHHFVTEYANFLNAQGFPAVTDTSHIPIKWPYGIREGGGPLAIEPDGTSAYKVVPATPAAFQGAALNAFISSNELGGLPLGGGVASTMQTWHGALHTFFCGHGDSDTFSSPREPALYWFHKRIDNVWQKWMDDNPNKPHFNVVIKNRTPGRGGTISRTDMTNIGVVVKFSDPVEGVLGGDMTVGGNSACCAHPVGDPGGSGPALEWTFKFGNPPAAGNNLVVTLNAGAILHKGPVGDPDVPMRNNPLNDPRNQTWMINVTN